jgi:hypothetical protein
MRVHVRYGSVEAGQPLALRAGSTALDVTRAVHSELATRFKAARVWGSSVKFDGQRVGRDHIIHDGDTVEIIAM